MFGERGKSEVQVCLFYVLVGNGDGGVEGWFNNRSYDASGEIEDFFSEERASDNVDNRNGRSPKRVLSDAGPLAIRTPRDRNGDVEPVLVGKRKRELGSGLDDQLPALKARGYPISYPSESLNPSVPKSSSPHCIEK